MMSGSLLKRGSLWMGLCIISLSGCATPYDQTTDDSLTSIQKQVDAHVADLSTQAPTTQPTNFNYSSIDASLHSLSVRVTARAPNDPSINKEAAAIQEYQSIIDDLPALEHTASTTQPVAAVAWKTAQTELDTAIQAILALELQRKK
jgi:hypothetical protein